MPLHVGHAIADVIAIVGLMAWIVATSIASIGTLVIGYLKILLDLQVVLCGVHTGNPLKPIPGCASLAGKCQVPTRPQHTAE
jgi:hypothetical protein